MAAAAATRHQNLSIVQPKLVVGSWRHQIACKLCSYCWPAASASSCCLVAVQLQPACRLCVLAVQLVVAYWMKYNTIVLLSSIAYKTINYCCLNIVLLHNKVHRYCLTKYSNINMRPNGLENGGNCMKNKF